MRGYNDDRSIGVYMRIKCLEQDLDLAKLHELRAINRKRDLIARLLVLKCQLSEIKESDGVNEEIQENGE